MPGTKLVTERSRAGWAKRGGASPTARHIIGEHDKWARPKRRMTGWRRYRASAQIQQRPIGICSECPACIYPMEAIDKECANAPAGRRIRTVTTESIGRGLAKLNSMSGTGRCVSTVFSECGGIGRWRLDTGPRRHVEI